MIYTNNKPLGSILAKTPAAWLAVLACMVTLCGYSQQITPPPIEWQHSYGAISAGAFSSLDFPDPTAIQEAILRANDYFITHDTLQTNGWARGVYQTGNMRAYQVLGVDRYLQAAADWATRNQWLAGVKGPTDADGQVCGQTYVDLYRIDPQPIRIAAIQAGIDGRVAAADAVQDWWWIDAFYMAAPVFARFGNLYSTNTYFDKLWLMYDDMKSRRALFDPAYGLWYRDAAAQTATTQNGQKQFWGRGNGWVMAGLARVIEQMPPTQAHRADFILMLQTMAAALKPLQGADGMWRASLLDSAEFPNPETSCTGLFTYALAWGIRNGYLDAADYQSVVARAWNGMVTNVLHSDGLVGYVQAQGRFPAATTYDTTYDFGVGTFLLAGSEVLLLVDGGSASPVISSQPMSQGVAPGLTVTFSETATGTPPLSYQWLKDGVELSGATNATLIIVNTQTNDAGNYSVVVTNAFGSATSTPATLTVLTLPLAMDTPNWTWTTGGNTPWTGQSSVTHDGTGAAQSGSIAANQTTWLETTLSGPVTMTFWWKVSSETNKDLLRFYVNGSEQMRLSGEVDWQWRAIDLPAGNQVLRWAYSKNSSTAKGQDRGWVDQAGIICTYALSPPTQAFGFEPDSALVTVATSNSLCPWSTLNTNSWITITSSAGGSGSGSIGYMLAANPTAIARTGVVMIADQAFTVSQAGAPCTFALFPTDRLHGAGAETGLVSVTTIPGCDWTVSNTNDWIAITTATNGTGSGSIGYVVAANPSPVARIGVLGIADQFFTVTNLSSCSQTVTNTQVVLAGTVFYPTNYPAGSPSDKRLASVPVILSGDASQSTQSAADGSYGFTVNAGGNYTVTPDLPNSDPVASGITTVDISLIRRHILQSANLDSPYKLITADVNGSKSVTTLDIFWVRKLILGSIDTLPAGRWRLIPSDYVFPDPENPWDAPASHSYTNLLADSSSQDFLAIKLGDVNNTWTPPSGLLALAAKAAKMAPLAAFVGPEVTFQVSSHTNQPGEKVVARVTVGGFRQVTSAQFTLAWDPAVLRYEGAGDYGLNGLAAGSFGNLLTNRGELTFSWDDPEALGVAAADGTTIFSVSFAVIGNGGDVSPLALVDSATEREVGVNFARAAFRAQNGQVMVGGAAFSPLAQPKLTQAVYSKEAFAVSVPTVSGQRYILEFTGDLPGTNWTALPAVTGDGTVKVLMGPAATIRQRFYRLRIE